MILLLVTLKVYYKSKNTEKKDTCTSILLFRSGYLSITECVKPIATVRENQSDSDND